MLPVMPRATGVRARVREELTREIKDSARRQLAAVGASELSLRAVARELGMASSAVYRYYPSRDDLLTALIVDAYDALGTAVEQAEAAVRRSDVRGRFRAASRAVREWALANVHEYALIYGSPVPGYAAPQDTIGPATRTAIVLTRILADAHEGGRVTAVDSPVPARLRPELETLAQGLGVDVPAALLARGLTAWMSLFGAVNFELFGQLHNVVDERDALFEFELDRWLALIGLE